MKGNDRNGTTDYPGCGGGIAGGNRCLCPGRRRLAMAAERHRQQSALGSDARPAAEGRRSRRGRLIEAEVTAPQCVACGGTTAATAEAAPRYFG
jgi:hypothetical protein